MFQRKIIALDGKDALKALSDGSGQLVGYASVWDGLDSYGDTIQRGAYSDTIQQFVARGTLHAEHDSRIRLGTIAEAVEDDHGLLVKADFHSDAEAQRYRTQILERIERGKFVGLSIGYVAEDYEQRDAKEGEVLPPFASKVRILKRIHLYEISEVSVPADSSAEVLAAKSRTFDSHFSDVRVAVTEWLERVKSGSDMRAESGREPLTAERRAALEAMSVSLKLTADQMDALLVPPAPPEFIDVGMELRRRRYASAGIHLIGAPP